MFRTTPEVAPARYYYTRDTTLAGPLRSVPLVRRPFDQICWQPSITPKSATRYSRAEGRVEPTTTQDYQARGNNYYDNDKTLTGKLLRLIKDAREKFRGRLCTWSAAACDGSRGR